MLWSPVCLRRAVDHQHPKSPGKALHASIHDAGELHREDSLGHSCTITFMVDGPAGTSATPAHGIKAGLQALEGADVVSKLVPNKLC